MRVFASQSQSPFLVFSQSCVSSHENRQGLRGEDLGGLRGGGWTRRGGRGWNGPKKADTTAGTGPPAVTKVILGRVPQNTGSIFEIHDVCILICYWLCANIFLQSNKSQPSVFICCFKTSFHWGQVASSSSTCFVGEVVPLKLIIILAF